MKRFIPIAAVALFGLAWPAQAAHERSDPAERLTASVHRIEHATSRLYERVALRAERGQRRARRVLPALRKLDRRAERFAVKVHRDLASPQQLRRQHRQLAQSLRFAEDCAKELDMHKLRNELHQIQHLVTRLDRQIAQVRVARREVERPRNAWGVARRQHERRQVAYDWPWRAQRWARHLR